MSFERDTFNAPPAGSGVVPAAAPAPSGLSGLPHDATARHHGAAALARHTGVVRSPHTQALSGSVAALHHPHPAAAAASPHSKLAHAQHRTHQTLPVRAGTQKTELGQITAYDAVNALVTVRLLGSQSNTIGPIPLGYGLNNLALLGSHCLVTMLDEANPADAIVVALYDAPLTPLLQGGNASLVLSSFQLAQTVTFPVAFPNAVSAVVATSRDASYVASVSGETTTGFLLTLTRREGAAQIQSGTVNVSVGAASTSGTAGVTFPATYATARVVTATSTQAPFCAYVTGIFASGFTAGLWTPTAPGSLTVVAVDWLASGDPLVSATVVVDWYALGR